MKKLFTLCFIRKDGRILLGMKKRGFGEGRWNGFGGKVEDGETIDDAAKREFNEECGVNIISLRESGVIDFTFLDSGKELEVHVFEVIDYVGIPEETEEMIPGWFDEGSIPFDKMWIDDVYWIPLFLQRKVFKGNFVFENEDKIRNYELKIV
ncbi:MAG: 8-oxo-dGTP diphosphatase [Candidatus Pacebacteria bacterium]|nr:8-oxo-dGTP diphosphatase [Candidatus Paceibacterota bacterium]